MNNPIYESHPSNISSIAMHRTHYTLPPKVSVMPSDRTPFSDAPKSRRVQCTLGLVSPGCPSEQHLSLVRCSETLTLLFGTQALHVWRLPTSSTLLSCLQMLINQVNLVFHLSNYLWSRQLPLSDVISVYWRPALIPTESLKDVILVLA